jgi:hypothetical protein
MIRRAARRDFQLTEALQHPGVLRALGYRTASAWTTSWPLPGAEAGRNPDITVAELLGRAAEAVEGKFQGQPETPRVRRDHRQRGGRLGL